MKPPKIEFTAKIKTINMKGVMTVQFSDKIVVPANYTRFNDDFLAIKVVPQGDPLDFKKNENKTLKTWQIVSINGNLMDI